MSRFFFYLGITVLVVLSPTASGQTAPDPDSGDVIINEIMFAPSPASNEFIELYNRTSFPINLGSLEYADENRDFDPVSSSDTTLSPGGYVVLIRDPDAFHSAFPGTTHVAPNGWNPLNNGGDTVRLRHGPTDTILDSVPYDPAWGGDNGNSLERVDPGGPSDRATNFGSAENSAGATPSTENSIYNPDTTPPSLAEVRPTLDGDTLIIHFSEAVSPSSVSATAFRFPDPEAPAISGATVSDTAGAVVHCALSSVLEPGSYTLVASGIEDNRGNAREDTRGAFDYFTPDVPAPGDITITEIMYAPSPSSSEFIEIYNRSNKTIDVGSLHFADENQDFHPIAPPLTPLRPDSHAVLVRDAEAFASTYPHIPHLAPNKWDALNNGGDEAHIQYAPSETTIDAVPYLPSWGGSDGHSLERIDPAGPSDLASNFGSSVAEAGATPGRQNSLFDPDETPPTPLFAEQIAERAVEITFSEPILPASLSPDAFELNGSTVTSVTPRSNSLVRLSLNKAPTATRIRIAGVEDRVGNSLDGARLPLAHQPSEGEIVVNEIMYAPRTDDYDDRPNQVEYVELFNLTKKPLTLHNLHFTDRPNERGVADTIHVPHHRGLPPRGYGLVSASPSGTTAVPSSQLAEAFPDAPLASDSVTFVPIDAARLGLDNDGDRIQIHRANGTTLCDMEYTPDWHAPGLKDPAGTALERISPTGNNQSADNWTSSTHPEGGTPGAKNAVSLSLPTQNGSATLQIAPSPFSIERDGATRIRYTLADVPNLVRAEIFDARGRHVRTLEDARLTGRSGELMWNGRDDAGNRVRIGIYVVLFEAVRAQKGTVTTLKEPVVVARPLR